MDWKIKSSAILAAFVTVAILLVNYLANLLLGKTITSLFAISIPTNINPISMNVGQKIVGLISGYIPFNIPSIAVLYIATLAAVLLGVWIASAFKLNFVNTGSRTSRIAKTILVGTIPLYLIIVGVTLPANFVMVGIFVVIYTLISSFVAAWAASTFFKMNI